MSVVADRAAQRSSIEGQLVERQRLLSSIKDQIASLEAAELLRQQRLAAQAQARFRVAQQAPTEAAPEALVEADSVEAAIAAPPDARFGGVVGIAMQYLGTPYVWGGASPGGFDCSGLTKAAYDAGGIILPRTAHAQFHSGPRVPDGSSLLPGDLVFYGTPASISHVALYLGNGKMIHAPTFGSPVQIDNYRHPNDTYVGATRPSS